MGPGPERRIFVTTIGDFDKDGDGAVMVVEPGGKTEPFVTGLDDPKGIAVYQKWLFLTDKTKVIRIDATAKSPKAEVFAATDRFPVPPIFLNDIAIDQETGAIYVSDSGKDGKGGAVYRVHPKTGAVTLVVDEKKLPGLKTPNGLANDGTSFLLLADFGTGILHRIKLADGTSEKVAEGLDGADGVTWDYNGRLYISSWKTGKVFVIPRPGEKPVLVVEGFQVGGRLLPRSIGQVHPRAGYARGHADRRFPPRYRELRWMRSRCQSRPRSPSPTSSGPAGVPRRAAARRMPLRPIVLTHAGDGSNRVFVATQHGVVHMFPNDPKAAETNVVLDIQERVQYDDRTNEEGLLGMAFHPRFKETGEVFIYYTPKRKSPTRRDAERGGAVPAQQEPTPRSSIRPARSGSTSTITAHSGTTTAARSSSGRTVISISFTATAASAATRSRTARTSARRSARFCASTSTRRRTARTTRSRRTTRS